MNLPPDILLYALIAAGLLFWLKSMLGVEDDQDGDNNQNDKSGKKPFFLDTDDKEQGGGISPSSHKNGDASNNVARLNTAIGGKFHLPRHARIENKTAEIALEKIMDTHHDFDLVHFLDGAQNAYIMVVEAFADKDRDTLENLLSPDVFAAFNDALDEQEKTGERIEANVKTIRKVDIIGATEKNNDVAITLRFTASEQRAIYDKEGDLISGHPSDLADMLDIWTFSRDMGSSAPNWYVTETMSEEADDEDHSAPNSHKKKATKKAAKKTTKKTTKKSAKKSS